MLDEISPEIVINATGANAVFPKPFQKENVCTVTSVLNGDIVLKNKNVAVIGSGMTGLETSELLCEYGNKVSIIEMADDIAPGAYFQQLDDALPKLNAAGTKFYTSSKLTDIQSDCVVVENTKTGEKKDIPADYVVLSLGCRPDNILYDEIMDSTSYKVINIGDSVKIGRIASATEAAFQAVMSVK